MLLSHNRLVRLVEDGVITGLDSMDQINGTSIDIRLGPNLLVEAPGKHLIDLRKREPLRVLKCKISDIHYHDLKPEDCILGHSVEMFNLPATITAIFQMKSSSGRVFLNHQHSSFCDPYWNKSTLTLELKNDTRYHTLRLWENLFIGQLYFMEHEEVPLEASYAVRGRYNGDRIVQGVKL